MPKRRRPLTGLTAYFYRKKRPVFKYCTSSSEEDETRNTNKIPSSDQTQKKADCQASSADSEDTKNKESANTNSSDSGEKKPALKKPIF